MSSWIESLEMFLKLNKVEVLENKGSISKEEADQKALEEYEKFRIKQDQEYLSDFDRFLEEVKEIKP